MMLHRRHVDDMALVNEALLLEAQPHPARSARTPAVVKDHHGRLPKPIRPALLLGVWCHTSAIPGKVRRRSRHQLCVVYRRQRFPCCVMAGHSRPKDGVASARLCPGHPRPFDRYAVRRGCPAWQTSLRSLLKKQTALAGHDEFLQTLLREMRGQRMIGGLVEERGFLGGRFQKLLVLGVDVVAELDRL